MADSFGFSHEIGRRHNGGGEHGRRGGRGLFQTGHDLGGAVHEVQHGADGEDESRQARQAEAGEGEGLGPVVGGRLEEVRRGLRRGRVIWLYVFIVHTHYLDNCGAEVTREVKSFSLLAVGGFYSN